VKALSLWLGILLLAVAAYGGYKLYQHQTSPQFPEGHAPPRPAWGHTLRDFELTDSTGRTFAVSELDGEVWLVSFFFASCRGECPQLNHTIARLLSHDLREQPVRVVSITVDPTRDTVEALAEYAQHFYDQYDIDPQRWIFARPADGQLDRVRHVVEKDMFVSYALGTHTNRLIVIDAQRRVTGAYSTTFDAELRTLVGRLESLLQPQPQPAAQ
jgi:protein SCO1/2